MDSSLYLVQPSIKFDRQFTTHKVGVVTVRSMEQDDIPRAADVIGDSFKIGAFFGRWLKPLFKFGIREDLYSRWRDQDPQRSISLVAIAGSQESTVIGTIEVSNRTTIYHPTVPRRYAYIANLAVDNSYRSLGIGRQMVAQCELIARDWGFGHIYLHVMADNQVANHLYTKLGFEMVASDLTWHLLPWKRASRLFLRKAL